MDNEDICNTIFKKINKIKYGNVNNLPEKVKKEINLHGDLYKCNIGEQAHIEAGLKNTLEKAGFEVLSDEIHLKRDGKLYGHQEGEKIYYIEDIENIIKLKQKERDKFWIEKFDKYSCIKDDKWYLEFKKELDNERL